MIEREIKLGAGADFALPDLRDVVAAITATEPEERRLETVYYDTPDLRLARWGCSLRLRQGEGWTLKLPSSASGQTLNRRELEFPGDGRRPPDAATTLVMAYVRRSSLVPVASLSTLRRRVRLQETGGPVLAEVVDDDVSVIQGLRVASRFREVEVELRDAAGDRLLEPVLARLRAAGAADGDNAPKLMRALGPRAAGPPEVAPPALTPNASGADLVRHAIATSVAALLRHDPGVRLGDDSEDIHRARVATRRLRSQLRTFRGLVQADWASDLRDDLRWLADGLGAVRDKQVLAARLRGRATALTEADAPAVTELAAQLEVESEEARGRLVLDMRSERYIGLLERLVDAARNPSLTPESIDPASRAVTALAGKDWRRLRKAVKALGKQAADAELHHVRIMAKRARYAAEAAAPVVGKDASEFAAVVTSLQDVLGDHQDSVTAQQWLRRAADGPLAFVAGELCAIERDAAAADRARWLKTWKIVTRKRLRRWMI
ncbi:MAG: CYTH and CHAD domain-containing protein [Candidatus Dormibacteraeota bacterium]|nr:CYTH and CHAD domain-containing protein [Candidatus Dormibacteraeota bacterium]